MEISENWMKLDFRPQSPNSIKMITSGAGILPDQVDRANMQNKKQSCLVGIFENATAQEIITRVVSYRLNVVQLNGNETPTLIRNLHSTLKETHAVKFMKGIKLSSADDISACLPYTDCVDFFLFFLPTGADGLPDKRILNSYHGDIPYLIYCENNSQ